MFGFLKNRLFDRMIQYVDVIKIIVFNKISMMLYRENRQFVNCPQSLEKLEMLSAAVVNRLFASEKSSMHSKISSLEIDEVAVKYLESEKDEDLIYGIVMSLRTLILIETNKSNIDEINRISTTILWIKSLIPISSDAPNPELMETLSKKIRDRYSYLFL